MIRSRAPLWLLIPAVGVFVVTLVPLGYLLVRAAQGEGATFQELVLRYRNLELIANTLGLAAGVVLGSLALAMPLAWLTTRTNLRGRRAWTVLCLLPLAIPGYVIAYSLLSLGSPSGPLQHWLGIGFVRPGGFWGALVVLTMYNYPLMFLNLRSTFADSDPSLSEAARSLGYGKLGRLWHVTLPQLRPAMLAGTLLVGLYVLGDFGVVSLMRFETISYAIYLQYMAAFDRVYAAMLAVMLIGIAGLFLWLEFMLLRGLRVERSARTAGKIRKPYELGSWKWPAYAFAAGVVLVTLFAPFAVLLFWLAQRSIGIDVASITGAIVDSLSVSLPAAALAAVLAVPIAWLEKRYRSGLAQVMGRAVYIGYAMPPLALALGFIFLVLRASPWLYQTATLLVIAYTIHFLAQAVGPVRSRLYLATRRTEEASRSLGFGPFATLRRITYPILRPGLVAAGALVFLSCVKELPLTFLLAPLDFETLALRVYGFTTEAMFAEAAPYAIAIVVLSTVLIAVLLKRDVEFS